MKTKLFYAKEITERTECYSFMSLLVEPVRKLKKIYKKLRAFL